MTFRRMVWTAAIALALTGVALACSAAYVSTRTARFRYSDPAAVPHARVAIVFGAGVERDGTPSGMLADRLNTAVELYRRGVVHVLLLTGDHSRADYDEVGAMQRYAVAHGVPASRVALDFAGFRTYDSCYRARAIFGVERAVLVTQRYHLARALYTCRRLGIDAVGIGTPDWGAYSTQMMTSYTLREWVASAVAIWQIEVTRPRPAFLGRFEGLPRER